jgi:hypothetical protein
MLNGADLYNSKPMKWLIGGVLPSQGLAALYGASGSGKSFLTLDLGFSIASGNGKWFGRRVTKAPVTYVCLEGEAGMGKRVKAWQLHHKTEIPSTLRFVTQSFDLLSDDVTSIAKSINDAGGANGLVILDTLNRASAGVDENSSGGMGNIIEAAKKLQRATGGLVLLVHHTGKDTSKGLRGHSSLYAALDGAIEVSKSGSRCEWCVAKSKDDLTGTAHQFSLEIVNIGKGYDDEDDVTSCIVNPEVSMKNVMKKTLPPKSGNQKIIWDVLQDVFKNAGTFGQSSAPSDKPCILLEDAIDKTRGQLICEIKRQTERTQTAIAGLINKGLLGHKDGWLWVI